MTAIDETKQAIMAWENTDVAIVRHAIAAWMLFVGVGPVVTHVPVRPKHTLLSSLIHYDSVVLVGSRVCIPLSHLDTTVAINILLTRLVHNASPDRVANMYWYKCSDEIRVEGRDPSIAKQWLSRHIEGVTLAVDSMLYDQYAYDALLGILTMMADEEREP